ncbi:MAG: hypothetical protein ACRD2A_25010, partial [Vicinamibacterales bacterium]
EIKAGELMGNFNALVAKFSSGIVDADCSVNMNLQGTKLLANSVPANRIIDGSLTTLQLATDSVETADIKDGAVTTAKLGTDSVTTAKILANNVTTAKIPDANVTKAKLSLSVGVIAFTGSFPNIAAGAQARIDLGVASGTGFTNSLVIANGTDGHIVAHWWERGAIPVSGLVIASVEILVVNIRKDVAGPAHWYLTLTNAGESNTAVSSIDFIGRSIKFAFLT